MVIVNDLSTLSQINHPGIQALVLQRLCQLQAPGEPDGLDAGPVEFLILEGGEMAPEIELAFGIPIFCSLFDGLPFDHPDFYPPFEIMEEHHYEQQRFYEMVFISNDDGAATSLLVPDQENINRDLLAMCRSWATPAVSTP